MRGRTIDDARTARARGVRIEAELERRGIGLRRKGKELTGPCPQCGGDDRFSVHTQKQIFNCRGCGVGGDVIALVQHLDGADFTAACTTLAGAPASKAKLNGKHRLRPFGRPAANLAEAKKIAAATYEYLDEAGNLAFVVVRVEYQNADGSFVTTENGKHKKDFRQRRPDPERPGKWIWNVNGVAAVPYRLVELIEAVANGNFVVIVEGERKVDHLWSWNVPATCNACGSGKWKPEHSEYLRGADVIILPDNDQKGLDHADTVGASLHGVASSVRVLELPDLPAKGDIVDWAEQGGTVEKLHELIAREAKPWAPRSWTPKPTPTSEPTHLDSAGASTFKMAGVTWLWPNRFALGKLGLIAGLPDRGKGLLCADMAARVTTGDLWPCDEGRALQGNVLLLSAEDDIEDTIIPRLVAAGADLKRVHILRMVRTGDGKRMFSLVSDLELLRKKIEEIGNVVMVQVDPLSAYLGVGKVDSYRTTDVRGVLAPLTELAAEKQISLLGILHFNKKTDVDNAMLRISDSLAFAATARHCYCVVDDPDNKQRLFIKAKNNLAPDTKALSFAVNAIVVGQDEKTGKDIWAPRVVWGLEHVDISATAAMQAEAAGKSSTNPRTAAKTFLAELLANGPVAKHEIEEAADANCISTATLRRAKDELGIITKKSGLKGGWTWQLPDQQPVRRRVNDD
jgi:putative DNA primase/helicase